MLRPTLLAWLFLLLLTPFAFAGTAERPEILDWAEDTEITAGVVVHHIDMTRGWVEHRGDDLHFVLEVASANEIPVDAVYAFHYTFQTFKFFWLANWTIDGSEFQFTGGIYEGAPSTDRFGNRRYLYLPGQDTSAVTGEFQAGAPARFIWKFPLEKYGAEKEEQSQILFTGMFIATYIREDRQLTMMDHAEASLDYHHQVPSTWWDRLRARIPGPSPILLVGAIVALAFVAARARR